MAYTPGQTLTAAELNTSFAGCLQVTQLPGGGVLVSTGTSFTAAAFVGITLENGNTLSTVGQQPYIYRSYFPGAYAAGQTLDAGVLGIATTFPANMSGGSILCTAPTGTVNFTVLKNGTVEATGTVSASATSGTFGTSPSFSYSPTDKFSLIAPASADATFGNLQLTMVGTR